MSERPYFPYVSIAGADDMYTATCAIAMQSILHGSLFMEKSDSNIPINSPHHVLNPERQQQYREKLVGALCSWPRDVMLELHMTSYPDLMHRVNGTLKISLFIHATAPSLQAAQEEVITRYLALMPLLASLQPEAEFVPVSDHAEFIQRFRPFERAYATSIQRVYEEHSVSSPFPRTTIGFLSGKEPKSADTPTLTYCYPWVPSLDDWSIIVDALMRGYEQYQVVMRFQPGIRDERQRQELMKTLAFCETIQKTAGMDEQIILRDQVDMLRKATLARLVELSGPCCNLSVHIMSPQPIDASLAALLGRSITKEVTREAPLQGGYCCREVLPEQALNVGIFPDDYPFSAREASCAFRIPSMSLYDRLGLPLKRSRTAPAYLPVMPNLHESLHLFTNEHAGMRQPIVLSVADRMRHMFIAGQSGSGKSTHMESLIMQDIHAGRGVALIDPHGDLVDSILGKIPEERINDVILFDTAEKNYPPGFNLLQYKTIEELGTIIDELYLTVDRTYDMRQTGGPMFESNFRGMLKLLMSEQERDNFHPTLLEFTMCYQNSDFRKWLYERNTDPQVKDFIKELEASGGEASLNNLSAYITSKFSRFVNDTSLKRIIGQETSTFDIDDIMNNGKIFLVKLNKGRFGSVVSSLLSNQIVSRFKLSAMKRGEMRPQDRRDFFLYIDEAHNLPSEDLIQLLSEARKYRLGLVLATQYTSQFQGVSGGASGHNTLLSSVLGNVGTIVLFKLGLEDARLLESVVAPQFNVLDIIGLPLWKGYARLQISGDSIPPFSFSSDMDTTPYKHATAELIRSNSRQKYGRSIQEIDEQIQNRRTMWKSIKNENKN